MAKTGINDYSEKEQKETKKNNRTIIAGNAIIINSRLSLNDIEILEKFANEALCIKDEEKDEEIFRVSTGNYAEVSKFGIIFAEENKDGKAQITELLPENLTNKKEYVKENYVKTVAYLIAIEDQAIKALDQVKTLLKTFENSIEEI